MKLTEKQHELWKLAGKEMDRISNGNGFMGGMRTITRNPDKAIRDAAKTEGTREWALCTSMTLSSPLRDGEMNDEFCQRLIDIISV